MMSDFYSQQTQPDEQKDLAGQWRAWIGDPANRASLIQTGLSLMQPVGLGQTPLGHAAQAIGSGGEAADRIRKQEMEDAESARRDSEAESRSVLREARATAAEARAGAASSRIGVAGERLSLERDRMGLYEEGRRQQRLLNAQKQYAKEASDNALLGKPSVPFDEWLSSKGLSGLMGALAPAGGAPAAGSGLSSTVPGGAGGGQWFKVNPSALSRYPDAVQNSDGNWYVQR